MSQCGCHGEYITSGEVYYTSINAQQLFSSLYNMLPSCKSYLLKAGWSSHASAYALIGLFLAGVIVIRIVSSLFHHFIPSHVVDCAHTHEPEPDPERGPEVEEEPARQADIDADYNTERTPLLKRVEPRSLRSTPAILQRTGSSGDPVAKSIHKKEPLRFRLTRQISRLIGGTKPFCDENGPCYGFSQTCGGECTKTIPQTPGEGLSRPLRRHKSMSVQQDSEWPHDAEQSEVPSRWPGHGRALSEGAQRFAYADTGSSSQSELNESRCKTPDMPAPPSEHQLLLLQQQEEQQQAQHHHHVPQNAFLSIGLQTSLAIALHKLPEGFITYATNHASHSLGMSVFFALFIHNISEGFALALPLYLALHSRWKAMFWASLLGGVSQPAGAGLAALWILCSQEVSGEHWGVYGALFAATAGIMTSVALQLFSEGLALTHKRGLGVGFAIGGMGLMGLSGALTA